MISAPVLALALMSTAAFGCMTGEEDDGAWNDGELVVTPDDQAEDAAFAQATQDGKADGSLTYTAVARLVVNAGVECRYDRVALAVAIAKAESGFDPDITNTAGNTHGIDRGLWQINSYWHPEVSAECATSASCNARAAARISHGSTRWGEWWTYKNNKHLQYMSAARTAQAAVCGD